MLNGGRHPITNATVIPEDVVEHVALGASVSLKKAEYPETVSKLSRGVEVAEHLTESQSLRMWPESVLIPRTRDHRARRK